MLMFRYVVKLIVYVVFYVVAMLLAPVLPLFRITREGPINNNNGTAVGPYLPDWLYWFSTNYDNSLYGDYGWRSKHCVKDWNTYYGMVKWLWRNAACGFSWSVVAEKIDASDKFTYTHSGNGLDVDKGKGKFGWYLIKKVDDEHVFSYRWCKKIGPCLVSFSAGWLLDVYVNNPDAYSTHPKAIFEFQPQLKFIK